MLEQLTSIREFLRAFLTLISQMSLFRNQTWSAESSQIETRRVEPSNCESSLDFRGNARLETRQLGSKLGSSELSFGMGSKNRVELGVEFDSTRFGSAR